MFDKIALHASFTPQKPAVVLPDRVYTFEMLHKGIASVQAVVADLSWDREQVVGIAIDNPARHLIVLLALFKSGFTSASLRPNMIDMARSFGVKTILTGDRLPITPGVNPIWIDEKWFSRADGNHAGRYDYSHGENRIATLEFSSGSTGTPKAFAGTYEIFHRRNLNNALLDFAASPRFLTLVGLSGSSQHYIIKALMRGNTLFFAPPEIALATIHYGGLKEVRCSAVQARALLDQRRAAGYDVHLDLVSTSSAELPLPVVNELQSTFGCQVMSTYASTEMSVIALCAGEVMKMRAQRGNCFLPLADIEIVDENNRQMPRGAEGRIRARNDFMRWPFNGTLFETEEDKGDGWFYPGDLGRIDDDGLLIVTGRADEVINAGGIKFSPEAFEDALRRHPRLSNAAVVRVIGPSGASEACVAVPDAESPSVDEINRWINQNIGNELGDVQISRVVKVDEVPLTPSGKIARHYLRAKINSSQT